MIILCLQINNKLTEKKDWEFRPELVVFQRLAG